ncbi:hypothetical protein LK994_01455 [Ferruginibacter lapsinanis]|uniref:hypothetical protein n=1 Tax=Ferruginibacter lapsinanis TaxID=563172 RepID=UPI001E2FC4B8|nr:hypothetical protein [Ferruginibacter lapsinanis]UEG50141.1 hypothetical protein LK994_01455 [Ferruginibacter lapsinanis]
MSLVLHRWIKLTLINLLIVAAIGVALRYKIAYSLPIVNQKHLLHGHSHFAFAGWISQAIMTLLVAYLAKQKGESILKKYRWLLYANVVTAYGMLVTFPFEGYGLFSITFSTLSIFVSYAFAIQYWKDLNTLETRYISHYWFKTALFCNVFSSLGAFSLAAMMAAKISHQNWFLAAEYFYLHFQYNGWFFFSCMGLIVAKLFNSSSPVILKRIYLLFAAAIIPAYFLSALWMDIPLWVYILVVLSAVAQIAGWGYMLALIKNKALSLNPLLTSTTKQLLTLSAIALSIKLLLQLGSTIPSLSTLTFGFRPIVIGYLHLVLLGVITIFILGYMFASGLISLNKKTGIGITIFVSGIIINELFLMVQGVTALNYFNVPYINEALLAAAVTMFTGLLLLNIGQKK